MTTLTDSPTIRATWSTPIGPMRGVVGEAGLRELHFAEAQERPALNGLAGAVQLARSEGELTPDLRARLDSVTTYLREYFAGRPAAVPPIDPARGSAFDRAVWTAATDLAPGETLTYGELATRIGRPGAARAVGGALSRNPLVLVVPCHRIVARSRRRPLGGFSGGLELKSALLAHEGRALTGRKP